jgi:hypothetical protein
MEMLPEVKYNTDYRHQRAEELWDFSNTKLLMGFCFGDFTRMYDISQKSDSPALEELSYGNLVWPKYILNSLESLKDCPGLIYLSFSAKKIF